MVLVIVVVVFFSTPLKYRLVDTDEGDGGKRQSSKNFGSIFRKQRDSAKDGSIVKNRNSSKESGSFVRNRETQSADGSLSRGLTTHQSDGDLRSSSSLPAIKTESRYSSQPAAEVSICISKSLSISRLVKAIYITLLSTQTSCSDTWSLSCLFCQI